MSLMSGIPANTRRSANSGSLLVHRQRCWTDNKPALVQCRVFTVTKSKIFIAFATPTKQLSDRQGIFATERAPT